MKSIKKNYFYNLFYQILVLLTPFITTPYISRVLGADGVGTVSYAESIVSYFTLFATLGITTFGQREISYVQDEFIGRSKKFWEIKIFEFFTSLLCLTIYLVYWLLTGATLLYLLLMFNILAVLVDITWFFQGLEEFGLIVFRNVVIKVLNIICIFVFVKQPGDFVLYAFFIGFFSFLSNVSLWGYLKKYICKVNLRELHPFDSYKEVLALFIPTIAIQIYTVLDKTMIGVITQNSFENGYYEQAIKISKMVMFIVTSLGTVMIPRVGYFFSKNEHEKVKSLIYSSYRFVWFMGIPLCLGLISISDVFIPWFLGEGFSKTAELVQILAFLILAIGLSNVTGTQYLIPTKKQNIYTSSVCLGACVNFVLNILLIPKLASMGAAVASVVAEFFITLFQIIMTRNYISPKQIIVEGRNYYIAGAIMFFITMSVKQVVRANIIGVFIIVLCGVLGYTTVLILIKDSFLYENIQTVLKKIRRD